ncbi:MAG: hypothetical protein WDA68_03040 [Phycisphaerae bacterium]
MEIKTFLIMTLLSFLGMGASDISGLALEQAGNINPNLDSKPEKQNEPYRIRPPPPE